jgi:oligoendopeptidase F
MTDIRWDLTPLYSGFDDPQLHADEAAARAAATTFVDSYRGRVAELDGAELLGALQAFDDLTRLTRKPGWYASLRFAEDTEEAEARAAQSAAEAFAAEVSAQVVFFGLEIKELSAGHLDVLTASPELRRYAHYLAYQRIFEPYSLDEQSEATITRKDVTGKSAWVQLYQQITGGLRYSVDHGGEVTQYSPGEIFALMESPDRSLRQAASQARSAGFAPHEEVLTFIFNTLFEDHRSEMSTRGYERVTDFTVLHDDLSPGVMDAVIDSVTSRPDLSHRYEALRARLLGLDDYSSYDRAVPLFGETEALDWDEAKAMVLGAFETFSPALADVARGFFDDRRIDAFPRPGKAAGGFCSPGMPPDPPYVLMNFNGTLGDVFTLAHELGHAVHFSLALEQPPVNYFTGMPLAETASIFAELLLHEDLMSRTAEDPAARVRLLHEQVQSAMHSAWTQVTFVQWERAAHLRRAEGTATAGEYSDMWIEQMQSLLGPGVQLTDADRGAWMRIPHFIFARFYCYSYAFGKLLTMALYGVWKERGDAFVTDYMTLLAAGGSESPATLLARLGLDLGDPAFWARGVAVVEAQLTELEALTS